MLDARPRRLLTLAAAGAAAVLASVAVAGTALAQPIGSIDSFTPNDSDGTLTMTFSASGLAPGQTIDAKSVRVLVAGQEIPSTAAPATSLAKPPARTTFLVMDVSGSMANDGKLPASQQAAKAYVDGVPADVRVGVIAFDSKVTVLQQPTTDKAAVRAAIDKLKTNNGDTHLFDAVEKATSLLGTNGIRSQLVLSDGQDQTSSATVVQAAANLKAADVRLDAVALGNNTPAQLRDLNTLAKANKGQVVQATNAADLTAAFESAAQAQATALVVRASVPQELRGGSKPVTIAATAAGIAITGTGFAIMPASAATATPSADITAEYGPKPVTPTDPGIFGTSWLLPAALAALGVGLFVLLAVALLATDREAQTSGRVRRRLSRYSLTPRSEKQATQSSGNLGDSAVARSAVELAGRVVQSRDLDTALGGKLEAAGVPLRPAEWLIIHIGITIVAALVLALLSGFGILATLIGLVIGFVGPFLYLTIKEGRRKARFASLLPETLQLLSGSLAAGYSLPQAVDAVARESDGPMGTELNRAIVEARLGVPMEDALETVARRMNSVDFAWVVMAIRIQREVGGNLSEVLSNVAATMRERERLRRQVDVLSAEGRLSAIILGLLPVLFILYLVVARPDYLSVMLTTPLGLIMIVVGIILLIAGSIWLRKVVKVEV